MATYRDVVADGITREMYSRITEARARLDAISARHPEVGPDLSMIMDVLEPVRNFFGTEIA